MANPSQYIYVYIYLNKPVYTYVQHTQMSTVRTYIIRCQDKYMSSWRQRLLHCSCTESCAFWQPSVWSKQRVMADGTAAFSVTWQRCRHDNSR